MKKSGSFQSLFVDTWNRHRGAVILCAAIAVAAVGCLLLFLCAPAKPARARAADGSETDVSVGGGTGGAGGEIAGAEMLPGVSAESAAKEQAEMVRRMEEIYDYLVELDTMVTDNQTTLEEVRLQGDEDKQGDREVTKVQEKLQKDVVTLGTRMDNLHEEITNTKELITLLTERTREGEALTREQMASTFLQIENSMQTIRGEFNESITDVEKLINAFRSDDANRHETVINTLSTLKESMEDSQRTYFSAVDEKLSAMEAAYAETMEHLREGMSDGFADVDKNLDDGFSEVGRNLDGGFSDVNRGLGEGFSELNGNLDDRISGLNEALATGLETTRQQLSDQASENEANAVERANAAASTAAENEANAVERANEAASTAAENEANAVERANAAASMASENEARAEARANAAASTAAENEANAVERANAAASTASENEARAEARANAAASTAAENEANAVERANAAASTAENNYQSLSEQADAHYDSLVGEESDWQGAGESSGGGGILGSFKRTIQKWFGFTGEHENDTVVSLAEDAENRADARANAAASTAAANEAAAVLRAGSTNDKIDELARQVTASFTEVVSDTQTAASALATLKNSGGTMILKNSGISHLGQRDDTKYRIEDLTSAIRSIPSFAGLSDGGIVGLPAPAKIALGSAGYPAKPSANGATSTVWPAKSGVGYCLTVGIDEGVQLASGYYDSPVVVSNAVKNNGNLTRTLGPGEQQAIVAGYYSGGAISAVSMSGTYAATARAANIDMGVNNTYRYVNTNGVPNSNGDTYTFAAGDTGGTRDLGETNTYRYVNAANVYDKGKQDGVTAARIGTAGIGDVLRGKTFTNASSSGATGTMPTTGDSTGISYTYGTVRPSVNAHGANGTLRNQTSAAVLNVGVGQAVTLPTGYYAQPVTVQNSVVNLGSVTYPRNAEFGVHDDYLWVHIPEGAYTTEGYDWAPEVRLAKADFMALAASLMTPVRHTHTESCYYTPICHHEFISIARAGYVAEGHDNEATTAYLGPGSICGEKMEITSENGGYHHGGGYDHQVGETTVICGYEDGQIIGYNFS